jgi:glutaredoxin 3
VRTHVNGDRSARRPRPELDSVAAKIGFEGPAELFRFAQPSAILYEVMSDVKVYTTEPCAFCARVKGLLKSRGVEFTEINLAKDPTGRAELARETGMMTFPQVIIDGTLVGGFSEVHAASESGRLDELLAA